MASAFLDDFKSHFLDFFDCHFHIIHQYPEMLYPIAVFFDKISLKRGSFFDLDQLDPGWSKIGKSDTQGIIYIFFIISTHW